MNKKLLALLNAINDKKAEVKSFVEADELDKAKAAKEELKALQDKFDILKDMEDDEPVNAATVTPAAPANATPVTKSTFATNVRKLAKNTLVEGTDKNGGYLVPKDVQTRINHYKETHRSIRDLVTVENVTTKEGSRVYETRADLTGFAEVDETGNLQAMQEPSFEQVTYDVRDFGGYLPVSNDLLNDNDADLESEIVNWVGRQSLVTDMKQVLAEVKKADAVELSGLAGIKKAVTVTVGSAYSSKIVTNDDGVDYLDQLTDNNGRPLLNPDPTAPANLQLRCGAKVIPVEVFPNCDMPSDTTTSPGNTIIPFIIGDLAEAFHIYDRQQTVLFASNVAMVTNSDGKPAFNAFQQRGTLYRADMRADYKTVDKKAFVRGQITVATTDSDDEDLGE